MPMMSRVEQRFWVKVDRSQGLTGCWEWTASKSTKGYGHIKVAGKLKVAHRLSYEWKYGPIPEGMQLDHFRCSNRGCVNPDHVRPVSARENALRSDISLGAVNLARTHCKQGHEFTEANTYIHPGSKQRDCRVCIDVRNQKYREANQGKINARNRKRRARLKAERELG